MGGQTEPGGRTQKDCRRKQRTEYGGNAEQVSQQDQHMEEDERNTMWCSRTVAVLSLV